MNPFEWALIQVDHLLEHVGNGVAWLLDSFPGRHCHVCRHFVRQHGVDGCVKCWCAAIRKGYEEDEK